MEKKALALGGALAVALSATGAAQVQIDPSRVQPLSAPVQDAGTYDWVTRLWTPPGAPSAPDGALTPVYDNTCTWSGGGFVFLPEDCQDVYDEGRIPSPSDPNAPAGAVAFNRIDSFRFQYCTDSPTGSVDLKLSFWDNLGGMCVGGVPPTPPPISSQATAYFDFGAVNGFPLPGSSPSLGCFVVTISNVGFCLASDGDGVFDGSQASDLFTWSFQSDDSGDTGPVLAGDPASGPPGSCTYSIPCGTDPITGGPCGTGLDTADSFWVNEDVPCPNGLPAGTNCYFFGGWPSNPFASFNLALESSGACGACAGGVATYCTAKVTSGGCVPSISTAGQPNAASNLGFIVAAAQVEPQRKGQLIYSLGSDAITPFQGGFLCFSGPIQRTTVMDTGGSAACAGGLAFDFNAWVASGADPSLVAGQAVKAQYHFRDPAASFGAGLSNAVIFTLCP